MGKSKRNSHKNGKVKRYCQHDKCNECRYGNFFNTVEGFHGPGWLNSNRRTDAATVMEVVNDMRMVAPPSETVREVVNDKRMADDLPSETVREVVNDMRMADAPPSETVREVVNEMRMVAPPPRGEFLTSSDQRRYFEVGDAIELLDVYKKAFLDDPDNKGLLECVLSAREDGGSPCLMAASISIINHKHEEKRYCLVSISGGESTHTGEPGNLWRCLYQFTSTLPKFTTANGQEYTYIFLNYNSPSFSELLEQFYRDQNPSASRVDADQFKKSCAEKKICSFLFKLISLAREYRGEVYVRGGIATYFTATNENRERMCCYECRINKPAIEQLLETAYKSPQLIVDKSALRPILTANYSVSEMKELSEKSRLLEIEGHLASRYDNEQIATKDFSSDSCPLSGVIPAEPPVQQGLHNPSTSVETHFSSESPIMLEPLSDTSPTHTDPSSMDAPSSSAGLTYFGVKTITEELVHRSVLEDVGSLGNVEALLPREIPAKSTFSFVPRAVQQRLHNPSTNGSPSRDPKNGNNMDEAIESSSEKGMSHG